MGRGRTRLRDRVQSARVALQEREKARTADPQCVAVNKRSRKTRCRRADQYKKGVAECGICGRMRRRAPVYGQAVGVGGRRA